MSLSSHYDYRLSLSLSLSLSLLQLLSTSLPHDTQFSDSARSNLTLHHYKRTAHYLIPSLYIDRQVGHKSAFLRLPKPIRPAVNENSFKERRFSWYETHFPTLNKKKPTELKHIQEQVIQQLGENIWVRHPPFLSLLFLSLSLSFFLLFLSFLFSFFSSFFLSFLFFLSFFFFFFLFFFFFFFFSFLFFFLFLFFFFFFFFLSFFFSFLFSFLFFFFLSFLFFFFLSFLFFFLSFFSFLFLSFFSFLFSFFLFFFFLSFFSFFFSFFLFFFFSFFLFFFFFFLSFFFFFFFLFFSFSFLFFLFLFSFLFLSFFLSFLFFFFFLSFLFFFLSFFSFFFSFFLFFFFSFLSFFSFFFFLSFFFFFFFLFFSFFFFFFFFSFFSFFLFFFFSFFFFFFFFFSFFSFSFSFSFFFFFFSFFFSLSFFFFFLSFFFSFFLFFLLSRGISNYLKSEMNPRICLMRSVHPNIYSSPFQSSPFSVLFAPIPGITFVTTFMSVAAACTMLLDSPSFASVPYLGAVLTLSPVSQAVLIPPTEAKLMLAEENIEQIMNDLDVLICKTPTPKNSVVWRPTGNVKDDVRAHLMPEKIKFRDSLRELLKNLEEENKQLKDVVSLRNKMLLRTKEQLDDHTLFFKKMMDTTDTIQKSFVSPEI
ncbi:unnamed protein product [Acanthosepion pharaonis]|uniref:Uncharacterized protein n=1 Tax=Acanthosepion pharaonis TaxID=158019 RepID=A0A812DN76_ACAPH|nr:unnamed protein product [Sepia pharaonis]